MPSRQIVHRIRERLAVISLTLDNEKLSAHERKERCLAEIRAIDDLLQYVDWHVRIGEQKKK